MTDRPATLVDVHHQEQAAPDRKNPGSIVPAGADGSSPSAVSSVAGRDPAEGSIPRGTRADPDHERT
jgi:hypothetical protein